MTLPRLFRFLEYVSTQFEVSRCFQVAIYTVFDIESDLADENRGLEILGSPLGTEAYVERLLEERLQSHQNLLDSISQLPDPQTAWLLLSFCASPRANYILRTVPPRFTDAYATAHDNAMISTLANILRVPVEILNQLELRRQIHLPGGMGGMGSELSGGGDCQGLGMEDGVGSGE